VACKFPMTTFPARFIPVFSNKMPTSRPVDVLADKDERTRQTSVGPTD
jgi:hypothetical protein